ncbi:MAG TPA: hypothetical protein VM165_17390 [Planctomycetaceae bacterium]|nr:hypothetical protein [Planctomycetaceae bacterium]
MSRGQFRLKSEPGTDAADNWKASKKKSIERIDGIVALIMAIERATTQPGEATVLVRSAGTVVYRDWVREKCMQFRYFPGRASAPPSGGNSDMKENS